MWVAQVIIPLRSTCFLPQSYGGNNNMNALLIEGHPLLRLGLLQMLERILADVLTSSVTDHQEFGSGNASPANPRNQYLSHNGC